MEALQSVTIGLYPVNNKVWIKAASNSRNHSGCSKNFVFIH